jgi:hypothetical protein
MNANKKQPRSYFAAGLLFLKKRTFTKTWGIQNKSFRSSLSRKAGEVRGQRPRSPAAAGEIFALIQAQERF